MLSIFLIRLGFSQEQEKSHHSRFGDKGLINQPLGLGFLL